jgi:hypothetical protein
MSNSITVSEATFVFEITTTLEPSPPASIGFFPFFFLSAAGSLNLAVVIVELLIPV